MLNLLAQVDGLRVAARTSSFAFRDPQTSVREIGRLLNVGTVLEGSVRTSGNRIRLTAQLINVEDGYHIWSQSYDRELDDIFAIQLLKASYFRAIDTKDWDLLASTMVPDVEIDVTDDVEDGQPYIGRDQFVDGCARILRRAVTVYVVAIAMMAAAR